MKKRDKRSYTILINQSQKKVLVLDNFRVRYNRMRKRIALWVEVLEHVQDMKFIMVTLTYRPEFEWERNHVRTFMQEIRKILKEDLLAYAWVAEIQKRGAVHYHVMLAVPWDLEVGVDIPYPDQTGMWSYGLTRVEVARTPFYLITYLGKEYQKDFSRYPKGIRTFAVYIRDKLLKTELRYKSLTSYQKVFVDEFGWPDLRPMTTLRKELLSYGNLGWRLWSFEKGQKAAVKQAEGWEKFNFYWKGRSLFERGEEETEQ